MAGKPAQDEIHAPVEDIEVPLGLKLLVLSMIVILLLLVILFVAVLAEIRLFPLPPGGATFLLGAALG